MVLPSATVPGQLRCPHQRTPHRGLHHHLGRLLSYHFCQQIKAIGDKLRELGGRIEDRSLINSLLVGLSEQFEKQVAFIPMMRLFPSFVEVRSILQLEAMNQTRKASRPPQVFHTNARPYAGWCPSPNCRGRLSQKMSIANDGSRISPAWASEDAYQLVATLAWPWHAFS
jgi:hypothetical protein